MENATEKENAMKKYVVINDFVDKYTKELCCKGEILELEDKRAKELSGYIEKAKEDKDKKGAK